MEKKKLPGFLQSIVDIPLALKGFPKNLFKKPPKNKKELDLYLRELSAYMWLGLVLIILGVVLGTDGVGMIVAMIGFAFIIFVFWKRNNVKNGGLGDQIVDLTCSKCNEMITYDKNVTYKVLDCCWRAHATKLPTKRGEEASTSPMNVSATGEEKTTVEITCKCQHCGTEKVFTHAFVTGYCRKEQRNVHHAAADKLAAQFENEVRAVSKAVFERGEDGDNEYGVFVQRYDLEKSIIKHFTV